MDVDLNAAVSFVATHARILEMRRLHLLLVEGSPDDVLAALDAYRNPDGGYGWALEPDLRSTKSQPVAAMHALEVLADVRDTKSQRPVELCDWLADHTLPDGGVPFGLPYSDTVGSAPQWADADATVSSLQMTAQLAAQAHRLARHRADIAGHPWLATATSYCLDAIDRIVGAPHAYELMFVMRFLDAVGEHVPRARPLVDRLSRYVISDGPTPVTGGSEGEVLHPLDFTPHRTRPRGRRSQRTPLRRTWTGWPPSSNPTVDGPSPSRRTAPAQPWSGGATRRSKPSPCYRAPPFDVLRRPESAIPG